MVSDSLHTPSLDILIKAHVLSVFIILSCLYLMFSNSPVTTALVLMMRKLQYKEAKKLTNSLRKHASLCVYASKFTLPYLS